MTLGKRYEQDYAAFTELLDVNTAANLLNTALQAEARTRSTTTPS